MFGRGGWRCLACSFYTVMLCLTIFWLALIQRMKRKMKDIERVWKSNQPNVNHQSRHDFFLGPRLHLSNSQGAELYFSGIVWRRAKSRQEDQDSWIRVARVCFNSSPELHLLKEKYCRCERCEYFRASNVLLNLLCPSPIPGLVVLSKTPELPSTLGDTFHFACLLCL